MGLTLGNSGAHPPADLQQAGAERPAQLPTLLGDPSQCCSLGPAQVDKAPRPGPTCCPSAGHTRGPPAEFRAPGQDAVGDPPPVQPWPLPGCQRVLCEAGRLPAFLCRYHSPCGVAQGPQQLRLRADPCPSCSRPCSPAALLPCSPSPPLQEPGCGKSRPGIPTPCLGFPRRPPRLRGGELGQDGAVRAVRWPPPEVPSAAPAGPQPCRPGHHAHPSLHHAATGPGAVCSAQAPVALTKGRLACAGSRPRLPSSKPGRAVTSEADSSLRTDRRATDRCHGALLPWQPQFHCGPEQPHPGGLETSLAGAPGGTPSSRPHT